MRNIWIDTARARARRDKSLADEDAVLSIGLSGNQGARVILTTVDRALQTLTDEQLETVLLVLV